MIAAAAQGFERFLGSLKTDDLMRAFGVERGSLGDLDSTELGKTTILHLVAGDQLVEQQLARLCQKVNSMLVD